MRYKTGPNGLAADEEGDELPDLAALQEYAEETAWEMMRKGRINAIGDWTRCSFEVTDETGQRSLPWPLRRCCMIGTVAWFDLDKKFGFVALNGGKEAFLHMSVLKEAGYVWVPRGTTMRVRVEADRGKSRVAEVLEVDPSTARPGENDPILRKDKT